MPIKIPDNLPAFNILEEENIFVMSNLRAISQDIRPIKIIIVNLMPKKENTENQILRLLSNSPLQVDIDLLRMKSHISKNTSLSHIATFYDDFDDIKENKYDGMIVTGAPVETLEFSEVDYWDELCKVFEWSKTNVYSSLFICWGAQAGLNYFYDIPKYNLDKKLTGVFKHEILSDTHPLLRGFDDIFLMPHSRNTTIHSKDILEHSELIILASSKVAGVAIVAQKDGKRFFITGHPEYDIDTLANEYFRDKKKGLNPLIPQNYFKNDDPNLPYNISWRSHANLLYINWLNYYVYQKTPFNIKDIK